MEKKYSGIRDIAKVAGVSVATVSRVINTPDLVSKKTLEQVSRVIREQHYYPNLVARSLYNQTARSIALFVLDLDCAFFIALIRSLNRIVF
ncbi:MAG: helix-turn-helix transcriptional regulator, partial [Oscillospiraceae bacterium]